MKKRSKNIFILIIMLLSLTLMPLTVEAKENNVKDENIILRLEDETITEDTDNSYATCEGKEGLLGDPKDEDSVAWLVQKILNYIKILGPLLIIILTGVDYSKLLITGDDEGMKKNNKKLIYRLILMMALFLLPIIVETLLNIFGIYGSTCGIG